MIYSHFIGHIGNDAKVIAGTHGQFLSLDIAVETYSKGKKNTIWVRVRSNKSNHITLSSYLKKGSLIQVEGTMCEPTVWCDRNGEYHSQLTFSADAIDFVKIGRKKVDETANPSEGVVEYEKAPASLPGGMPEDTSEDLPF